VYADLAGDDVLAHTMAKYRFTSRQICEIANKFGKLQDTVRDYWGLLNTPEMFVRWVMGVDAFGGKIRGR
jgi:hypothetical protein